MTGDTVYYRRQNCNGWHGPGKVLGKEGQFVLIRHDGAFNIMHPCHLMKKKKDLGSLRNEKKKELGSPSNEENKELGSPNNEEKKELGSPRNEDDKELGSPRNEENKELGSPRNEGNKKNWEVQGMKKQRIRKSKE